MISINQAQSILVTDFDGTVTKYDFYDLVCKEFPEISTKGFWQKYEQGEITHFEALRLIFSSINCDESQLIKIVKNMEIDPQFPKAIALLEKNGWHVVIASGGCEWYIDQLLKDQGVSIPVYANPGKFVTGKGLQMTLPGPSPFFSSDIGINKLAIVQDALKKTSHVAFSGDGRPDLAPALKVSAKRRFAKSWLANHLTEIKENFHPFQNWSEIAYQLVEQAHAQK